MGMAEQSDRDGGVGGPMVPEVMSSEVALWAGGERRGVCGGRAAGGGASPRAGTLLTARPPLTGEAAPRLLSRLMCG